MIILEYLKRVKDYPVLWVINILSLAAWFIEGNSLFKACASYLTVLVVLIIDIVFSKDIFPYARFILTIMVVNSITCVFMMLRMEDPSFHGCLPSIFYRLVEIVFYLVYLFVLVSAGFVVLMAKNAIVKWIKVKRNEY